MNFSHLVSKQISKSCPTPIIVEFTGVTGVGKTTLVNAVRNYLSMEGILVKDAYEIILQFSHLNFVKNSILKSFLLDFLAFPFFLSYVFTPPGRELFSLGIEAIEENQARFWVSANLLRNFIKRIGVDIFLKKIQQSTNRPALECDFIFCDEGILHILHNLFVHPESPPKISKIIEFGNLVPQPNIIIWITSEPERSVQCTLQRGHKRVKPTLEAAQNFVEHGYITFDTLFTIESIKANLLKVEICDKTKLKNNDIYKQATFKIADFLKTF